MKLADLPPVLQEFLGFFVGCRGAGFMADDITFNLYTHPNQEDVLVAQGHLKAQGKIFRFDCGFTRESEATLREAYLVLVERLPNVSDEELDALFKETLVGRQTSTFLIKLVAKGFSLSPGESPP